PWGPLGDGGRGRSRGGLRRAPGCPADQPPGASGPAPSPWRTVDGPAPVAVADGRRSGRSAGLSSGNGASPTGAAGQAGRSPGAGGSGAAPAPTPTMVSGRVETHEQDSSGAGVH